MTIIIRDAVKSDMQRCLDLLAALSSANGGVQRRPSGDGFEALLAQARGQIVVAEENDLILGLATVSYNLALRYEGEYCQLEELIVDPIARGKNIGGLLLLQTLSNAKARGCRDYGLYLLESTEHNRGFYEKYGFTHTGTEMRQRLDAGQS